MIRKPSGERYGRNYAVCIAVNCWLLEARSTLKMLCQKKPYHRERLEATGGTNGGQAVDGGSRLLED